jgi:hypothetical protein
MRSRRASAALLGESPVEFDRRVSGDVRHVMEIANRRNAIARHHEDGADNRRAGAVDLHPGKLAERKHEVAAGKNQEAASIRASDSSAGLMPGILPSTTVGDGSATGVVRIPAIGRWYVSQADLALMNERTSKRRDETAGADA